jgi:KDO2-lipid IV(A) lauroyltransferase
VESTPTVQSRLRRGCDAGVDGLIDAVFRLLGGVYRFSGTRLAEALGPLLFRLDAKHRRIAVANLERAFGSEKTPAEIVAIARGVFVNLVRIVLEIGWSLSLRRRDIPRYVRVSGLGHLQSAHSRGKGVLFLTAHIGNWELLPLFGGIRPVVVNVLYRPLDFRPLDRYFKRLRGRFGARLIPTAHAARRILGALGRGEAVAVLMDQNVDWYEGVFVNFFGHRACTNKGLALIALKTGAPVVPVFLVRESRGFRVMFEPALRLIRTGDKRKDIEANTEQYNGMIEAFCRRFPDQWFWVHQRWKTRPYQHWPR